MNSILEIDTDPQPFAAPAPRSELGFRFKTFQREDYARFCLHDGGILGHDTGLGKTLALYTVPALKAGFQTEFGPDEARGLRPLAPVLLVVPGDLHQRTIEEGAKMFKARVTLLPDQATFLRLSTPNPRTGNRELPGGYYLTSYTQLTSNGVVPYPAYQCDNVIGMMQILGVTDADAGEYFDTRDTLFEQHYKNLQALPTMTLEELRACEARLLRQYGMNNQAMQDEVSHAGEVLATFHCEKANPSFTDLPPAKKAIVRRLMTEAVYQQYAASIGQARWYNDKQKSEVSDQKSAPASDLCPPNSAPAPFKVKCVWSPSLADLCQDTFAACAIDEGVKMKGEDTDIGTGVRQINSRFKLVLTATPIKNRLPDVFRLAWWATGGKPQAHARFPYPDEASARAQFADEFLVSERNLTKEREKPSRFKKLTPQVCNVHRLWKMFAPIILRRRKADCGEDIVTKTRQIVRAPMGKEQAAVYRFHLEARYKDKNGGPAIGAQLQALRVAAANAASALLMRPENDEVTQGEPRAKNGYIPKLHSALKLIHQCLAAGEQVVVFSAFNDSLDILSTRLTEAGIPHCVADGRTSPKRRGHLAGQFALGPGKSPYPVMLAGVECMSEGHSFPLCNNVILMAYSWAWDKFEQAINRVHRLNSRWNVKVWPIICDRSIDRKLESMLQEKGDACELVLDGKLLGEQAEEVNLAELLEIARKEFAAGKDIVTIDEAELEKEWPPLRTQLNTALRAWRFKGLELIGVDDSAPVIELSSMEHRAPSTEPVPAPCSPLTDAVPAPVPPRPAPPTRSRPAPVLDLEAAEVSMFADNLAGLPMFD